MKRFGQDEYDYAAAEGYETPYYEEPYTEVTYYGMDTPVVEEPSEVRYVTTYQEQQAAIQSQATSGAGFFDIFKSIL